MLNPQAATPVSPLRWSERPRPIVALAPMDGITDTAYRQIVRRFNPDVVLFSEFTSADGFLRSDKVRRRLEFAPEEQPYFVQLFGNTPEAFVESSLALQDQGVSGIDINMGCPSKKIVASQHGSGLMREVDTACRIVEAVANACHVEVSVKTRLGWTDASGLVPFATSLASAGASLITIHGRTYNQAFSGAAQWEPIHALKQHLAVPLLGNGDVQDHADGLQRMGCLDGFMIGRAAIGNPWAFLKQPRTPSLAERVAVMRDHYMIMRDTILSAAPAERMDAARRRALVEFRKHLVGYLRGFPLAKQARVAVLEAQDESTLLALLDGLAQRQAA